ncbi:exodeoxyribonuclease V alpha subunit [Brevibacillus aydinogluensis]|uniref:SF1B family DNA helicase RecD2 n=1 Tax=Brevibacillus aydinogluensis TaxID=927786 RepID=UPI00289311EC|nr:ATP-dependent RecD-like DNA helicase [Brevibacillus aydinogluensis]MDT3417196.1 exodeoxyribonuclease V alpha subunit [Brevibacillus aydinogluensis]
MDIEIHGILKKVIFQKDDFLIGTLDYEGNTITIKGSMLGIEPEQEVIVYGDWVDDPKYGRQFVFHRWDRPIPKTKDQITAFLSSPLVNGCGKKRAEMIVEALGENALELIMSEGAAILSNIRGIGPKNAAKIAESIQRTFELQRIMIELQHYGISANLVIRAYQTFGSNTSEIIRKNPYELTKLNLIGFLMADEIAKKIGIMPNSLFRIQAALLYKLKELCFEHGHCFVHENQLIADTVSILNHNTDIEVTFEEVQIGLFSLDERRDVVIEDEKVYLPFFYQAEVNLARRVLQMLHLTPTPVWTGLIDLYIRNYEIRSNICLAKMQKEAIRKLFEHNILIITGGPGVGKTATIKSMIEVYRQLYPSSRIELAAPTGRASRKLAEVTHMDHAQTVHRLIGYRIGDKPEYNEENPLDVDLLIIDEASMLDVQLANLLFSAISPRSTKILLVGDPDQLPSVNPGNFLCDLLSAGVPQVKLSEVFRQARESQIVKNAHAINKGLPICVDHSKGDFFFLQREKPEDIAEAILYTIQHFLKMGYSPTDILVLSPMKRGIIGTEELNAAIQTMVNPPSLRKKEIIAGRTVFREGDKVIHIKNNPSKDVFNGDIGVIDRIDFLCDADGTPTDELGIYCIINGKEVPYSYEDLNDLKLGYCITIHKSQGGQAPVVIIPMSTSHYTMLTRNLLYTGITRAEKIVTIVGTMKAMNIAIQNNRITNRNSYLRNRIMSMYYPAAAQKQERYVNPWVPVAANDL